MSPSSLTDLAGGSECGRGRGPLDPRVTPHDDSDYKADRQGECEEEKERHLKGFLSRSLWLIGAATFPGRETIRNSRVGNMPSSARWKHIGKRRALRSCVAATRRLAGGRLTSGPSPYYVRAEGGRQNGWRTCLEIFTRRLSLPS
jgi:hypothetical protein